MSLIEQAEASKPKRTGRPSLYSQELTDRICERLAQGESLREICRDVDMPDRITVLRWLRKYPLFRNQYAEARDDQADYMADEILDIADNSANDYMVRQRADGSEDEAVNHDNINRSRLRVDARKWLMARLAPHKYGDRQVVDHISSDDSHASGDERQVARAVLALLQSGTLVPALQPPLGPRATANLIEATVRDSLDAPVPD